MAADPFETSDPAPASGVGSALDPGQVPQEPAVAESAGPKRRSVEAEAGANSQFSRRDLEHLAIRGVSWNLIHVFTSLPLAFAVNILLARVLGVVDYGRLAYLTSVMTIASSIISMGLGTGVVQFGAKAHASGQVRAVQDLLSGSQALRIMTLAPLLTLIVIMISNVSPTMLIIAVVSGVLLPSVLGGASYAFGIENKTAQGAQNTMIINFLTQAAVVIVIFTIGTADAIWAARLVVAGLGGLLAMFYVARDYRNAVLRPRLRRFPAGFWRFALPAGAASAMGALLANRAEVVVLTWLHAANAAGIFALAFGLAGHLFAPAQALVGPLIPAISGLHVVDRQAVSRALSRTLRSSATSMALILAAALPPLAFLVPIIYGADYAGVPPVMLAMGASAGLLVIASPLKAFLMASLSGGRLFAINVAALVADLVLMLVLIPPFGVWGAVIGNFSSAMVQVLVALVTQVRSLDTTWPSALRALAPYPIGAAACVTAWLTISLMGWSDVASAAVSAALGFVLVIVGLRLSSTGLSRGDADAVLRSVPRRLKPVAMPVLRLCTGTRG